MPADLPGILAQGRVHREQALGPALGRHLQPGMGEDANAVKLVEALRGLQAGVVQDRRVLYGEDDGLCAAAIDGNLAMQVQNVLHGNLRVRRQAAFSPSFAGKITGRSSPMVFRHARPMSTMRRRTGRRNRKAWLRPAETPVPATPCRLTSTVPIGGSGTMKRKAPVLCNNSTNLVGGQFWRCLAHKLVTGR